MSVNITWLGHAGIRLQADKVVYIDPWEAPESHDGDIVLITHEHYDHCVAEDIARTAKPDAVIVAPSDCHAKIKQKGVKAIKPGDKLEVNGITIEAVPAYNTNAERKNFHPPKNQWVGYIITIGGERIYHAGDTDAIPEMANVKADIALLPIGGTYTMTAEEAVAAVDMIKPKVVIPIHYNKIVGSDQDAERFKKLVKTEVRILKKQ